MTNALRCITGFINKVKYEHKFAFFLQLDGSIWAFCNIGALGCNKKAQWWTSFLDLYVFFWKFFMGGGGLTGLTGVVIFNPKKYCKFIVF